MKVLRFKIITLGCKLNFAESSCIAHLLRERGFAHAGENENADFCILHSCCVTREAEKKTIYASHRMRRENPDAILILIGCYAQLMVNNGSIPTAIAKSVDYVIGQKEKFSMVDRIVDLLQKRNPIHIQGTDIKEVKEFEASQSFEERTRCFLKIQDGCDYHCSYCTIPFARGKSRNPTIDSLKKKSEAILQSGFHEIVLSGVNVGDFGKSTRERFIDLLFALDELSTHSPYRIRISSCEPNLLSYEIIDFVATSKHFAPHFHLPLQSGSDTILKMMGRRYTCAEFKEKVEYIKSKMPHAFIGIDCMVGVRGESKEFFEEYRQFLADLPFSELHVFTYSERPNTRILSMPLENVPSRERHIRSNVLQNLSKQRLKDFYLQEEGKEATVLWEEKKITIGRENLMYGFTENYIRLKKAYDASLVNRFEKITLCNQYYALE